MWEYQAALAHVIDGDTYVLDIDLGFNVSTRQHIRLKGAYCPELHDAAGPAARDCAASLLTGAALTVITERDPVRSFERYVATVILPDGRNLADALVTSGHATHHPE